jgi:serine phosphatase RsbU (regulator of sigma subunit)
MERPGSREILHLQQQVARLQALLEVSRQVHSTVDEEEVLKRVLRIVVRELEMAGAAFPSTGMTYGDLSPGNGAGQRSDGERKSDGAQLRYPLADRDGIVMTELHVAPPEDRELSLYEVDFLEGLTLQAAVALENARNHKRNLEFVRLQRDIEAAREIQRSLTPLELPEIPGYSAACRTEACYQVGGDYLDLVLMQDGSLLMTVADVAGKGLASAIMASSFRSAFRAMAASGMPLDELATHMNRHHWLEGIEAQRRYVTAILARLYPEEGRIEVVNAGHNPGFLLRPGEAPLLLSASGTPLGLLEQMAYASQSYEFPEGSRLLLYTDGLTEAARGKEEFGPERLLANFSGCMQLESDAILDALWAAIAEFSSGCPQGDDMTALALCHTGSTETAP